MRALAVVALISSGCATNMSAPTPMTSVRDELKDGPAKCLVVFLPGVGDSADDFSSYGFVDALRERNFSVDIVSANATLGYYVRGKFIDRLNQDVVTPARSKPYEQTWFIGISMGGMGALRYASEQPEHVTGVLALAPFLGDRTLSDEIRNAGGLSKWKAPEAAKPVDGPSAERQLWRWVQSVTSGGQQGPSLYAGWGTEDRFAPQVELLAAELPTAHTFKMKGAHRWSTWRPLFGAFLSDSDFTRGCSR